MVNQQEQQFLLSLLQFVALVTPAMAVLTEVLEERYEWGSDSSKILEGAISLIIFGGLIIGYQLLASINNPTIYLGSVLIFGSLLFVILAIFWRFVPFSLDFTLSTDSIGNVLVYVKRTVATTILLLIPVLVFLLPFNLAQDIIETYLNLGPIRGSTMFSPSLFFLIITFLLVVRLMVYITRTDVLFLEDYSDSISDILSVSLAILVVYAIFVFPIFVLFISLIHFPERIINISVDSDIFLVPYAWSILFLIVLFGAKVNDEQVNDESEDSEQ